MHTTTCKNLIIVPLTMLIHMLDINNEMSKSNIKSITIQNTSVIVYVCFDLWIVCLYTCVCECPIYNNNHKTKHKNNSVTNCGSAFEPGASGLPYYCTSICVRSWGNWRASCVDSKTKNKSTFSKHLGPLEWARAETGGVDRWVL